MRIAMPCRQHPDHLAGGLSIASWNFARAARDAGHEVVYMTAQRPDGFDGGEKRDGMTIIWLPKAGDGPQGYPQYWDELDYVFMKHHQARPFDIVHSQSSGACQLVGGMGGANRLRDMGIPSIWHDHGSGWGLLQNRINEIGLFGMGKFDDDILKQLGELYVSPFHELIEPDMLYMRRYTKILATSSISYRDFQTRFALTNVELCYCSVKMDVGQARATHENDPPVVAFFAYGLDQTAKGVLGGLKSLLHIKDRISIKLIGGGTKSVAFAQENFPKVEATGLLPEAQAIRELEKSDVLFECSVQHLGNNLTGLTALGLGVPVVAYPTNGHCDMIGDNEAGVLVDPLDEVDICLGILLAAKERFIRGHEGIKRFLKMYSIQAASARLNEIYMGLIE